MSDTCIHNTMHGARCLECEVDMLNSELASYDAEVKRLNKWADGMTDIALKERATGEAYQRELRAQLTACHAWMKEAGHLPGCVANECAHRYPGGLCSIGRKWHDDGVSHHFVELGPCTCKLDELTRGER